MRRRIILQNDNKINYEYVDLGLPSGILWATTNVGAEKESDYGWHFQWGDSSADQNYFSWDNYKYCTKPGTSNSAMTKYNSTDRKTILEPSDDAATVNMGEGWRMPTNDELLELTNNCTTAWTKINETSGVTLTSTKTGYTNKSVFFPAAGLYLNTRHNYINQYGFFWSSSLSTTGSVSACTFNFLSTQFYYQNNTRNFGMSVRGVRFNQNNELVDLGLPSGTLWAKCNIGASTETEYGRYYQFGKGASPYQATYGQSDYDGYENPLKSSFDTATQILGEPYHTPTQSQIQELFDNTTNGWTTINGVNGRRFMNKTDYSKYIFIPATGYYYTNRLYSEGAQADIWSSTSLNAAKSYYMSTSSTGIYIQNDARSYGFTIRPVVG